MAKFRAIEKGYYGDVIHDPETDHHVIFEAPASWSASWAERVGDDTKVEPTAEVSEDTEAAEAILDAESEAARPDVGAEEKPAEDEKVAEEDDVNAAAGVETL